jgi:small-conductance mechanosensitive channel
MFSEFLTTENLLLVATGLAILIVMFVADRLVRRAIARYSKRLKLGSHVVNVFKLTARIIIFAVGVVALLSLFGLPTEWFVSVSALTGAAIGFASTQTVGNFLAGLYIMISRPFMVKDYVKIGDVEGQVREITINYTKIYMPTHNLIEIPNRQVLDSRILNYSKKDTVDYTFRVGFPPTLPGNTTNTELIEKCITPVIDSFYDRYRKIFVKKPEVTIATSHTGYMGSVGLDRLQRTFAVRVFFKEKDVEAFYGLQREILNEIIKNWDEYCKKAANDN